MSNLLMPDFMKIANDGFDRGREMRAQSTLSKFAQGAIGGDQNALSKIYQDAGADTGFKVSQAAGQQQKQTMELDEKKRERLGMMAKVLRNAPEQLRSQLYKQMRPELSVIGMTDMPSDYDDTVLEAAVAIDDAVNGGGQGAGVQSTYIDDRGQRVAIMRDGSTQILGNNAPNNQIIDTGNGFFGVNKGSLTAAPVQVGGAPQAAPQAPQAGMYQTPQGVVRLGDDLSPEQREAAMADIAANGGASEVQLPARNVAAPQGGGQLRSAPKQPNPIEMERLRLAQEAAARSARGNAPAGYRFNAQGSLEPIPGAPKPASAAPTEGERKAATLLKRMDGSLSQLEAAIKVDPDAASPSIVGSIAGSLPLVGDVARNAVSSSGRQQVEAAQLDILDAALTLGTGAAYTREQIEGYRKAYFPQIGDTPATIRAKKARLDNVVQAARIAAGRAAPSNAAQSPSPRAQGRPSQPAKAPPADDDEALIGRYL